MTKELREILLNSEKYSEFTFLKDSIPFNELFADEDFDYVSVYSTTILNFKDKKKDIVGFCGSFKWKDKILTSLDGDSYSEAMSVLGYKKFTNPSKDIYNGIGILVGNDW